MKYHITGLMRISPSQTGDNWKRSSDGLFCPETSGDVLYCRDLRTTGDGSLRGIPDPGSAGVIEGKFIGTDERDGVRYIFSTDQERNVILAGSLDQDGIFTPIGISMGNTGTEAVQMAAAGNFLIFLLSDGTLYYLVYEWDLAGYTVLGKAPALPEISIDTASEADITAEIGTVTFKTPIKDLRAGLTDEAKEKAGVTLAAAWQEAMSAAERMRKFVTPPDVRVVIRLWDGGIFGMSARLTASAGYPASEHIRLTPSLEAGSCTGISGGHLVVHSYDLRIRMADTAPGKWKDIIRSVEVYATPPQEMLDGTAADISYSTETGYIYGMLRMRGEQDLVNERAEMPLYRTASFPPSEIDRTVHLPYVPGKILEETVMETGGHDATAIAGHDAYIHTAVGNTVVTSRYGNPLVTAGRTDTGAYIHAVIPQTRGGGAYTRQILYLFTSSGIMVLAHDKDGKHTTCRTISRETATRSGKCVSTDEGVWALTDTGNLLLIRDCKVEKLLSGLGGAGRISWDSLHGELWIFPEDTTGSGWRGSLVLIRRSGSLYGTMRGVGAVDGIGGKGMFVCLLDHPREAGKSVVCIPSPWEDDEKSVCSSSVWIARVNAIGEGTCMVRFLINGAEQNAECSLGVFRKNLYRGAGLSDFAMRRPLWVSGPLKTGFPGCMIRTPQGAMMQSGILSAEMRGRIPEYEGLEVEVIS